MLRADKWDGTIKVWASGKVTVALRILNPQSAVDFEHPARRYERRCELCRHWIQDNRCMVVEGNVYPDDWCKLWEKNEYYPASRYEVG